MSLTLRIGLDNSQALYFPGQKVTGKVLLRNDVELEIRGVSIKFSGESQTKWSKGSETHSANEVYYVKRYFLLGNGTDAETLNPGEHVFRFDFELPLNIPSSYETYTGQVRHQCKAKVYPQWEGGNWEVVRPFSVNTLYDLNLDEDAKLPVNKTAEKGFLLSPGSMSMKLLMERTGFVPGEKIRIHCEVNNDSDKDIKCVKLVLLKDAIYHASDGEIFKYTLTLAKMVKNDVDAPGINVIWSDTGPIVPPVPPSYLQHCNIIDMRYTLKVVLCPKKLRKKLEITQPIIIGSIPLAEHFRQYRMVRRTINNYAGGTSNSASASDIGAQTSSSRQSTHFAVPSSNSVLTSPQAQSVPSIYSADIAEQFSNLGPISPPQGASAPPLSVYASAVLSHANSSLDKDSDAPPAYNPDWAYSSDESPIHPGHIDYPEMPPPSYIESQHSAHNKFSSNSNGTHQNPFIPSYLSFNRDDSMPGTPTCANRKLAFS